MKKLPLLPFKLTFVNSGSLTPVLYYQLSYTHENRERTEYVRSIFAKDIQKQRKNYNDFKKLINEWVKLEIERSKLKMEVEKRLEESSLELGTLELYRQKLMLSNQLLTGQIK